MIYTASALVAYLLGSFCASIPLSKAMCGEDIRTMGSGKRTGHHGDAAIISSTDAPNATATM